MANFDVLPAFMKALYDNGDTEEQIVCDYVGAMTDRYAMSIYESIFIPKTWRW